MTINAWSLDIDGDEYSTLTPEQQEFIDFVSKRDWEGGNDGLWGHSGATYFPESIKHLAHAYGDAMQTLDRAVTALGKELGIDW